MAVADLGAVAVAVAIVACVGGPAYGFPALLVGMVFAAMYIQKRYFS